MVSGLKPGLAGLLAAVGAGTCCAVPIGLMALGLGGGAFMASVGKFGAILVPLGWLGFGGALWVVGRRRWQCRCAGVPARGFVPNLVLLSGGLAMLGSATYLTFFYEGM